MNLKNEILLRANENIIIKETPIKKPKKKKKTIKEKIKLSSLLTELLLEAIDLSDGNKIIRALERGQIPNVKKKVFLNTSFKEDEIKEILDDVIKMVTGKISGEAVNKYLFLFIKRAGNIEVLDQFTEEEFDELVDCMSAYFGNKNKKEARENEEIKKKFDEYENSPLNFQKDKEFEQWAEKTFAHKAKKKDKDVDIIYDDGEWIVNVPKTFAAAKKLACMGDRKATWCTSARVNMFDSHTEGNTKLFIIRNEKEDKMFQMDWGSGGIGLPSFNDEKNKGMSFKSVLKQNIPENLWKSIKNKNNESVYDKMESAIKKNKSKSHPLEDTSPTPAEELEGWIETVYLTVEDFIEEVEDKAPPRLFAGTSLNSMRDVLNGNFLTGRQTTTVGRIAKYEKNGNIYYYLTPLSDSFEIANFDNYNKRRFYKIVLKDIGHKLLWINTANLLRAGLPKFFTDKPNLNKEKTQGDMNGWNEYIYSSVGEFLREIVDYKIGSSSVPIEEFNEFLKGQYNIEKIGKISKDKKVYYYIIANQYTGMKIGNRKFQRIAMQLNKDKLTFKTGKSAIQSDMPEVLKEKLFTSYINGEKKSIPKEELKKLKKGETPNLAFSDATGKIFINVNSFSKLMNIPSLGERYSEQLKKAIMENKFNPKDVRMVILAEGLEAGIKGKKPILIFDDKVIASIGMYFINKNTALSFGLNLSNGIKSWLFENFYKNRFSNEVKEMYENLLNDKPIKILKDGSQLFITKTKTIYLAKNGKKYIRNAYLTKENIDFRYISPDRESLSPEEVEEIESQGVKDLVKKAFEFFID